MRFAVICGAINANNEWVEEAFFNLWHGNRLAPTETCKRNSAHVSRKNKTHLAIYAQGPFSSSEPINCLGAEVALAKAFRTARQRIRTSMRMECYFLRERTERDF